MKKSFLSIFRMLSIIILPFSIVFNIFIFSPVLFGIKAYLDKPESILNLFLYSLKYNLFLIILPIIVIYYSGKKIDQIQTSALQSQGVNDFTKNKGESKTIPLPLIIVLSVVFSLILAYLLLLVAMRG
jgi:hypothetical protein